MGWIWFRANRSLELQGLGQIDSAGAGQVGAEDGGDETGRQHAVGNAATEGGGLAELFVEVDGVGVGRNAGKENDVGIGNGFADGGAHAGLQVFNVMRHGCFPVGYEICELNFSTSFGA